MLNINNGLTHLWTYFLSLPVVIQAVLWSIGILVLYYLQSSKRARRKRSDKAKKKNRAWRMKQSNAMLADFWHSDLDPDVVISRVRKMDSLAFEELVLSAISRHGHKIKRGVSYSGDGGIDGQAWINGQHHLLQMKRYSSYVDCRHITDFIDVCNSHNTVGWFIHSGLTGKKSFSVAKGSNVQIIADGDLILLLTGRE